MYFMYFFKKMDILLLWLFSHLPRCWPDTYTGKKSSSHMWQIPRSFLKTPTKPCGSQHYKGEWVHK